MLRVTKSHLFTADLMYIIETTITITITITISLSKEEPLDAYAQPSYSDLDTAASDASDPLAMLQASIPGEGTRPDGLQLREMGFYVLKTLLLHLE